MQYSRILTFGLFIAVGQAINLKVSATGGNQSSPLQYGIMFEDINNSGDGGIYAELIQNRAFQGTPRFPRTINPWTPVGNAQLSLQNTSIPLSAALPTSLRVASSTANGMKTGIRNPGFWGIDVKPQKYTGSFWVMGQYKGNVTASLESAVTANVWASVDVQIASVVNKWTEYTFELEPKKAAQNSNNTFSLTWNSGSSLNLNLISLFPPTYNNRPNGMRIDLMQQLKALNPSFLRMPGGNNLEGDIPPYYWKWNETIGPLKDRPGRPGTWGYTNTDGLGLVEYLFWCQDLRMEPILAVWSGLYLNHTIIPSAEALQPYVQDTMDELEFIMGDVITPFGKLRASLGYPQPWTINYVEVGNEDNLNNALPSYNSYRFKAFYDAIIAKYPHMNIMASAVSSGAQIGASSADNHIYSRPDAFVGKYNGYDHYSLTHKTLVGEYAVIRDNNITGRLRYPIWIGTVSEAVFLIGTERNTDHIIGASYAPLLQNLNRAQWTPDLIGFTADPAQSLLSTSYYQVELFSNTRTTSVLPVTADSPPGPVYWVAGVNSNTKQYILKAAVYNATAPVPMHVSFPSGTQAILTLLTAPGARSQNVLGGASQVTKTTKNLTAVGGAFSFSLPNYSIALLTAAM